MADPPSPSHPMSPSPSQLPPVPGSPVYSIASTANPLLSQFNLPAPPAPRPSHPVLSKADIESSQAAYADLLATAKAYRVAMAHLSTAASAFGAALESCARLKEARAEPLGLAGVTGNLMTASFTPKAASCTADTLLSASGVHHLIANHQQILSETVYRSFEVPLLHDLDKWQTIIDDEEETYQQKIRTQSKEVKKLEKEGLKLHKQKRRDVARFRAHLVHLTEKLDGLTTLHADHARTMLRESQETSGRIVDASCSLVRAEVDIFEAVARKGWTGGGLEDLLERGSDLFAPEDAAGGGGGGAPGSTQNIGGMGVGGLGAGGASAQAETAKLFSILPPRSILADSSSETSAARGGGMHHHRSDSLLVDGERYQSLVGVTASERRETDRESTFSADFNKPRGARPFSPQPIRRVPMTFDSFATIESPLGSPSKESSAGDERQQARGGKRRGTHSMQQSEDQNHDDGRVINGEGRGQDEEVEDVGMAGNDGDEDAQQHQEAGRSPELITDESSPESRWGQ